MNKLKITFYPDSDQPEFLKASKEYQHIWDEDGERIIETIERVSSLRFLEKFINAIVFEGISRSHPFCLRASYKEEHKKSTIIHELCHRLSVGNHIVIKDERGLTSSLENHRILNLILYDIWSDLYGEEFAKEAALIESKRQQFYKDAWDYALGFNRETRAMKFAEIIKKGGILIKIPPLG